MQPIDVDETLRELETGTVPDWIADHLRTYLESGGQEGHLWDSTPAGGPGLLPTLLLTTTGRASGQPRTAPLIYGRAGEAADDALVIVASKGGAPEHPRWYDNLVAEPRVEVQVGTVRFDAAARTAVGAERARLWDMMAALYPPYTDYQAKTPREIPVVVLDRRDAG